VVALPVVRREATLADQAAGYIPSPPRTRGARSLRLADGLVGAAFVAVPLACSPVFWDQFTSVKWYVFHAVAIIGAALFARNGCPFPCFVRRHALFTAILGILAAISVLATGFGRAVSPLLDRFTVVTMVLMLYAYLRRRDGDLRAICVAAVVATAATDAYVLAQHFGYQPFRSLTAGDSRSAFFGNVNIAAQFLGLSTPCLFWVRTRSGRRPERVALEALLAITVASIIVLGSRSVALGTGAVLLLWMLFRAAPVALVTRVVVGAAVLAGILTRPSTAGNVSIFSSETVANKAAATSIRLGLWRGTLQMIRDHPLGAGAGNFPDRFVPYQLVGLVPDERLLYRWPHNEWLRAAAEDGLPFAGLAALSLVVLGRAAIRGLQLRPRPPEDRAFLASTTAALGVESIFQFPFAMAPAALSAALLVALALQAADDGIGASEATAQSPVRRRSRMSGVFWGLAALAALFALMRVAWSEYLFVHLRNDRRALETACELDPRRVEACVLAAWQEIRAGDDEAGRRTLARILEHSPYYYPAVKLLGQEALSHGRREDGCLYLWMYDGLFAALSSVHATVAAQCSAALVEGFRARVTLPRYEEFPLPVGAVPR
jgi:O-antigen ligase